MNAHHDRQATRCGRHGSPSGHEHEAGGPGRGHEDNHVSRGPPFGDGGRLPRHEDRRPVPPARRSRRPRHPRLGRGREQGHVQLPRSHPPAGRDPGPAHRALELREVRYPPPGRRPLLLLLQRGSPEPGGPPVGRFPGRRAARAARPEHALEGRHRRARRLGGQRGRPLPRLRPGHRRLGLERVEGARRRHRQGSRRPSPVGQVLGRILDARRHRDSSTDASPSRSRARTSKARTTTRRSTSTSSARPRPTTRSSGKIPSTRNGRPMPRSRTTAPTSS